MFFPDDQKELWLNLPASHSARRGNNYSAFFFEAEEEVGSQQQQQDQQQQPPSGNQSPRLRWRRNRGQQQQGTNGRNR